MGLRFSNTSPYYNSRCEYMGHTSKMAIFSLPCIYMLQNEKDTRMH